MNKDFFTRNRMKLRAAVDADVIILAGNVSVQRSNDASFGFEQESNFWYLCGIDFPNWQLIMETGKSLLVAPDVEEIHRIFDGSLTNEDAMRISGADEVISTETADALILNMQKEGKSVATIGEDTHKEYYDFVLNPGPVDLFEKIRSIFSSVEDCRKTLSTLRAIKQPEEIAAIRGAIELTIEGFDNVKKRIDEYKFEYEIEADLTHYFRKNGAAGHAYDPIIASGKNACTLHYGKNQDELSNDAFVLLDVGARHSGYAADITRTYAYGNVSDRQRALHMAVEKAHKEIISLLKPGLKVEVYHKAVDEIMKHALRDLGLLNSPSDYRKYFPHSVSHGLGIDVHDSLGGPVAFLPGMVLTVEPGIYIPEEAIGVRIEDDILITETGNENLSAALPTSM